MGDVAERGLDGRIAVVCDGVSLNGTLAGLEVGRVRRMLAWRFKYLVEGPVEAEVVTTDTNDSAWQEIAAPESQVSVILFIDGHDFPYVGFAKLVPEDYLLRPADIRLTFRPKIP